MWGEGECTREDGLRTQRKSREDKVREGLGLGRMGGKSLYMEMSRQGGYFNQLGGAQQKRSILIRVLKGTIPCARARSRVKGVRDSLRRKI